MHQICRRLPFYNDDVKMIGKVLPKYSSREAEGCGCGALRCHEPQCQSVCNKVYKLEHDEFREL